MWHRSPQSLRSLPSNPRAAITGPHPLMAFLLAFPGRFFPAPPAPLNAALFLFTLNPLRSPDDVASPDLACRFLPPKPNFSFFFCRLWFGAPESERPLPADFGPERSSLSTATSKRSDASWVS